jgi:iron complex transport system ATP-binding protein
MSPASAAQPVWRVRELGVRMGSREVLRDVSFDLPAGQWWCVCGPNGAGKSTLLHALAGLQAHSGDVEWMGQPLREIPVIRRARQLGWMGQAQPVPLDLTVAEVVRLGRWAHAQGAEADPVNDEAVVQNIMRELQLQDLAHRPLRQLSGGECQRALLARAWAVQAKGLLLDEPFNHLDLTHQHACLQSLRRSCASGVAVLTVMHELHHALAADGLLVMQQGRLLHQGAPGDARTREALQEAFGMRLSFHAIDTHETGRRWVVLPDPLS